MVMGIGFEASSKSFLICLKPHLATVSGHAQLDEPGAEARLALFARAFRSTRLSGQGLHLEGPLQGSFS